MSVGALLIVPALLLVTAVSEAAGVTEQECVATGFRVGLAPRFHGEHFEQYEAFAVRGLPWSLQLPLGVVLGTRIDLTAGVLREGKTAAFVGTLGPSLTLGRLGWPVSFDGGVSPTYLSEDDLGLHNFGGSFHFTSHACVALQLNGRVSAAYRVQHMSNAGIRQPNPGMDLHMLEICYRF